MSSYQSRVINYIEGKNEEEVRLKLMEVALQLDEKLEIVNVYKNDGKGRVYAWYFHDVKKAPLPQRTTKKKTRKKKVISG